jgi:putative endonuclease
MNSHYRVEFGKSGEDLACEELVRQGYEILARRYRNRYGEIDIIARDGPTIAFIEVKSRTSTDFGEAVESITRGKQASINRVAVAYAADHHLDDVSFRFDVAAVSLHDGGTVTIEVIKSAFDAAIWC